MITIVIPVGPAKIYRPYLQECLDSIKVQTTRPDEVMLVDDMAHLRDWGLDMTGLSVTVYENPWNLGVVASINTGVALARNGLSLLIGSDDKLMPWAVADCLSSWARWQEPLGYYFCHVQYDNGETQSVPCGGAMVTKALWRATGGYPPKTVVGVMDSMFIDLIAVRGLAKLIEVKSDKPPIWCRRHSENLTAKNGPWWHTVIPETRKLVVAEWEKPTWC